LSTQPKYATQGASHRRTEDAILQATKALIAQSGLTKISMIDISSASEVARATLYNHYRDKSSVIEALLASEVARIIELSKLAGTPADALESLSIAISSDSALAGLREYDPALIAQLLIHSEHPLYFLASKQPCSLRALSSNLCTCKVVASDENFRFKKSH